MRRLTATKPSRNYVVKICRSFAEGGGGDTPPMKVFDRAAKLSQRDRAAVTDLEGDFDYLREHIASALVDRIEVRSTTL